MVCAACSTQGPYLAALLVVVARQQQVLQVLVLWVMCREQYMWTVDVHVPAKSP